MSADDSHIRVGHVERDRAIEALREAAGDGRLTLAELDERIEAAMAAKTRADLAPLVADLLLPGEVVRVVDASASMADPGVPGNSWENPLVLTARWDDVVRGGPWLVPPFLEVNPVAGNVKLNFVDARVSGRVVDVQFKGGAGDVVFVVPEGWGADLTHVVKGMGTVKNTVSPRPAYDKPMLVIRGKGSLGDLRVRYPNRLDTWMRDRHLAKGGGLIEKN